MQYAEHPPADALSPYIERYWSFALEPHDPPHIDHVVMPHGGCNITLIESPHLPAPMVTLQGPTSHAMQISIQQGIRYRGARLRAAALGPLLDCAQPIDWPGSRPQPLFRWHRILADHWQSHLVNALNLDAFAVLADTAFLALPMRSVDAIVAAVAAQLDTHADCSGISAVLTGFDLGERQVRRRFVAEVGLTPKVYARLRRIRRVCADMARTQPLAGADLAAKHGYADQAHLTRDIRDVFGRSATLLQQYLRQIEHENVAELTS